MTKFSSVCLVGGAGFLGRGIGAYLLRKGYRVTVVDRYEQRPELPSEVTYFPFAPNRAFFWEDALRQSEVVFNLAYSTNPKTSFENPVRDILDNLPFSVDLFEACLKTGIRKVLLFSSGGAVYGNSREASIPENHPTNPVSPYGVTKLAIEKFAFLFFALRKLPVTVLRPGNVYGVGQAPFRGQGFIATAIGSILSGKEIEIFGKNGTIRDYLYISDLAHASERVMLFGKLGNCYNVGSGIGVSNRQILEYLQVLCRKKASPMRVVYRSPRGFDVKHNVLDITKIKRDCGWVPKVSLEAGLKKTCQWLHENFSLRNQK
jgi:UDP-glucose 4-epimerase